MKLTSSPPGRADIPAELVFRPGEDVNTSRTLTVAEERWLSPEQKAYLKRHPTLVCLQPQAHPTDALYQTLRHGAVTLGRAMELDAQHDRELAMRGRAAAAQHAPLPAQDGYTDAEDSFIDRHGCSPRLA